MHRNSHIHINKSVFWKYLFTTCVHAHRPIRWLSREHLYLLRVLAIRINNCFCSTEHWSSSCVQSRQHGSRHCTGAETETLHPEPQTGRERLNRNGDALRLLKSQEPTPTDTSPTRPPSLIFPQQFLQWKPSINYESIVVILINLRIIAVSILPSQMKQRWATRLLPLKILFQKLQKKAPTMGMFLLHNLALPPMAWILVKRQFKMPM